MPKVTIKKISDSVKKYLIFYVLGLILNPEKKTCTKMAKILNRSHDLLYRFLQKCNLFVPFFPLFFIKMANHFANQKPGFLIIDDSAVSKVFAKCIEGISWVFNSSLGRPERGLCIVVVAWSNGQVTIPITFTWWFSKKVTEPSLYKTKIQHACNLIDQIRHLIKFDYLLADGPYFSKAMAHYLEERSIKFTMICASNRKITTDDGVSEQLKTHPRMALTGNNHSVRVTARHGDQTLYFIAQKRLTKNGEHEKIYLVSNMDLHRSEYIKIYRERWTIEPVFRTTKSCLGLGHCSVLSISKQTNHVYAVFFTYSFLQFEKNCLNLDNPEQALNHLRELKTDSVQSRITAFSQLFCSFA